MRKLEKISLKKIERISPSQFSSMKNCSYKSILAKAFDNTPLLPISPNAYFGTVMHNVLQRIAVENISDEGAFSSAFNDETSKMESKLEKEGYNFLIPLQKNVQDFGIRKILLKKHVRHQVDSKSPSSTIKTSSEVWLSTNDKVIGGYADLIMESDLFAEIVDYKTGAITHDILEDSGEMFSEIKPEYSQQLKLYAYAYFESRGRYPNKLTLVDLSKQRFNVDFTQEECKSVYEEAKALLLAVNQSISEEKFEPNVSEDNCKYCLYRPACSLYGEYIQTHLPFNDLQGNLQNVVVYNNGNINLWIENRYAIYVVTGINIADPGKLIGHKGKNISVYNLKREAKENVFSSRKTTIIYE